MADHKQAWSLDQLAKSEFFHQKLHEWGLLRTAQTLEEIRGEELEWDLDNLDISQTAWNKTIHQGVKPIRVFAHPDVLTSVLRSTSYYRMLSMVSQKSMKRIGLNVDRYEQQDVFPDIDKALRIARTLNNIISNLVETDEEISLREFDIWRGMAAGTQAQGSWQNAKGDREEIVIKGMLRHRLEEKQWLVEEQELDDDQSRFLQLILSDGRKLTFGDEPDIGVYEDDRIVAAVEVKGGIDTAGVLERVGAAIKSLHRAKQENPDSVTVLLMRSVAITEQARNDLEDNRGSVNYWFTVEDVLDDEHHREAFFRLLGL